MALRVGQASRNTIHGYLIAVASVHRDFHARPLLNLFELFVVGINRRTIMINQLGAAKLINKRVLRVNVPGDICLLFVEDYYRAIAMSGNIDVL